MCRNCEIILDKTMHLLPSPTALRDYVASTNAKVALVPTMGALHAGHISLMNAARQHADVVVASIFVNPTQFGPTEDFGAYPRTIEDDKALLEANGVDALYLPTVEAMYPQPFRTQIRVNDITNCLCGKSRPGHMDGVALVVTKLFLQSGADVALFGEKDFQQLCVIRQFVRDLDIPIEVIGVPTHREADGLAMSSRNRYLSENERHIAPTLYETLQQVVAKIRQGAKIAETCAWASAQLQEKGFASVDYLEIRDEKNLVLLEEGLPHIPARVFVAARLGRARLIDNLAL
jgi:pantoate--beta-alanine ligase